MILIALKMLIGNRAAFIGAIFGTFLAILLISQQSAIFLGLVSRSYRIVTDIDLPNIWVIDPATHGEDLIRSMPKDYLGYIRSIPGIEWAEPINYLAIPFTTPYSKFKVAEIYGVDDETLIGIPPLIKGNIDDLHKEGGIIIDSNSAENLLAKILPNGTKIPLKIDDNLEINGHRAVIVGIGKPTPGFYPQPIIFTTNSQFQKYSGTSRIQYIAAKTKESVDINKVLNQINSNPLVLGLAKDQLASRMANHFLKTGILINFALSVALGLIIGFSIAGQIFYIMTIHNLNYYALIKALGGTKWVILKMIVAQALVVGIIGYILGTGTTLLWGLAIKHTTLAFEFPWQLLAFTAIFSLLICVFTAGLSIKKVLKLDPQMLMINV
jgi:putative ABC transport system permease protein